MLVLLGLLSCFPLSISESLLCHCTCLTDFCSPYGSATLAEVCFISHMKEAMTFGF